MRRVTGIIVLCLLALGGMAVAGVRPALSQSEEKVTICHAAGLAGTTHYVTLTISRNAVFGPGGHFNENGTTQAGHEQDYMGACTTDTTTTDTTTTTTTTTDPEERGLPQVEIVCDLTAGVYRVSATWDDLPATVTPDTIPGDKSGPTLVVVAQGGDTQGIIVNTAGTCTTTTTTTTPPTTTTDTTTTTGETTTSTTPTTTEETTTTTTEEETTSTGETTTTEPPKSSPPTSSPPRSKSPSRKPKLPPNAPGVPVPLCPPGQTTTTPCAVQGNG
jgi:hypothetical protein